jgi:pilus assembly protein Flp/PilA
MRPSICYLVEFLQSEDGPTAVEYAVILGLLLMVFLGSIATLGSNTNNSYSTSVKKITTGS